MPDYSYPEQVTRQSGSNLALAFVLLPQERRRDITVFYAFCRIIDDLADAPELAPDEKREGLRQWRELLFGPDIVLQELPRDSPLGLAGAVRGLMRKYTINPQHFEELISGVEMDLEPARYATWEELRGYCYRVASVVGLISIEIFGYRNAATRDYAVNLGYALQLTNIIRDVARDARNGGRIYLPAEDLRAFGVSEASLIAGQPDGDFTGLMAFQSTRARDLYRLAREHLAREDRRSMISAEMMRLVYTRLLDQMERDGFRVFAQDYRLSRFQKISIIARVFLSKLLRIG